MTNQTATDCPQVTITNNLTVDVNVYDVVKAASDGQTLPFTFTELGALPAGTKKTFQTIADGSSLYAMYTGAVDELNQEYYYQFPIKIMSGTQLKFGDPSPLVYTLESADRDAMIQSFKFHKYAMANPNSALTANLRAALKTGDAQKINDFFAGTQNFKQCTWGSWNAVMTWLTMFTSGWQGPYYLYEVPASPAKTEFDLYLEEDAIDPDGGGTQPSPTPAPPVLVATLNILSDSANNSATLKMCTADQDGNPVYDEKNYPKPTTVVMAGDGTMTNADPGNDIPVSLTPVWMNVIQTTMQDGKPVTNFLVGRAVTGTIAGKKVVSSQTARQIPGKPADKSKQTTFDSVFGKIASGVGLLAGLVMIYEFASKKWNDNQAAKEQAKADAEDQDDLDQEDSSLDSQTSSTISAEYSSSDSSINFDTASSQVSSTYSSTSSTLQADTMTQAMDAQYTAIHTTVANEITNGFTPTKPFEKSMKDMDDDFDDAKSSISDDDFDAASATLKKVSTNMEKVTQENAKELAGAESKALQDSSNALKEVTDSTESIDKAQQEYEDDMNNANSDSGYDGDSEGKPDTDEIDD